MKLLLYLSILSFLVNWSSWKTTAISVGDETCMCDSERDRQVLVELYNSTNGNNWTRNDNWLSNQPLSEWFGVTTNNEGCVVEIKLCQMCDEDNRPDERIGNNLDGILPASLGSLSELEILGLIENEQLVGAIPPEVGNLSNLRNLDLAHNNLTGIIPSELGSLQNLRGLIINNNQLSGTIPTELTNLQNLRVLGLSSNQLSSIIPSRITNLENLTILSLSDNQLTGTIPNEIGNLVNLIVLHLSINQLTGNIPSSIGNIENLTSLELHTNRLTGTIPNEIGNLSFLTGLTLSSNQLTGTIPRELSNLQLLLQLYLNNNQLSGCFDNTLSTFCGLPNNSDNDDFYTTTNGDTVFYSYGQIGYNLRNNPLLPWQGDFERFCNDEDQIGASCDDNNPNTQNDQIQADCSCAGTIVNDCRMRDSLVLVELYNATDGDNWMRNDNWLSDQPIGEWFGISLNDEGCVKKLFFSENNLNGIIPLLLGDMTSLEELICNGNQLIGTIPSELGNLINLTHLVLDRNELEGDIPVELGRLLNLERLILNDNNLNGNIPTELGNLEKLVIFLLHQNDLIGTIPSSLGRLLNLRLLHLEENELEGIIPQELANLVNLTGLALADNNLIGGLGFGLENLNNLQFLYLYNNNLQGCFPEELITHCDVTYDFSNNPQLPWQGDFQRFCNGEEQIGASCDDGNTETENDVIGEDCACMGMPVVVNECRTQDSLALVALYESTDGANWRTTWDLNAPMDTWFGVFQRDGCVVTLALKDNNLNGSISVELGTIVNLEYIDLSNNNLESDIPSNLGNLSNLEFLVLSDNNLAGTIPAELGNLINLDSLSFSNNQLNGAIPVELGTISSLRWLHLSNNELSGRIPIEFGALTNLRVLNLYDNELEGSIPSELGNLSNLSWLHLSENKLTGAIPIELGTLTNLISLNLYGNQLVGDIPSVLAELPNLTGVYLNDNQLNGCFDTGLIGFCQLSYNANYSVYSEDTTYYYTPQGYNFSNNLQLPWQGDFERFCDGEEQIRASCNDGNPNTQNDQIQEDCSCTGTEIVVNDCRMRDSLVLVELYNATSGDNWTNTWDLNEPIDTWHGVVLNEQGCVIELDLSNNELDGFIPLNVGNLQSLRKLWFFDNNLRGSIPSELGNLQNLRELSLSFNDFNDNIPSELGTLQNLTSLWIHDSNLNGELPLEIGNLQNLTILWLHNNNLNGSIPKELGNLTNLTELRLYNNNLQGNIPTELSNLQKLEELYLFKNELSGEIPKELGNLKALVKLSFSSNFLVGDIPNEFSNLQQLTSLSLTNNNLSGVIPAELGNLVNLTELKLSLNDLTGTIPVELRNLVNLTELYIYSNQLDGEIPAELGSLINLEKLSLWGNNLSGNIPPQLGNLTNLTKLSLRNNNLIGKIPRELNQLQDLVWLYLSNNMLEPCIDNTLDIFCSLPFNVEYDGFYVRNQVDTIYYYRDEGYNFTNNPQLPWQGDFERFCNGEEQIGASCDDGNPATENDQINEDCECQGTITSQDCDNFEITIEGNPEICEGNTTLLTANIVTEENTTDYTYEWNSGAIGNTTPFGSGRSMAIVTVTDANGCMESDTLDIIVFPRPEFSIFPIEQTICAGEQAIFDISTDEALTFELDGVALNNTFNLTDSGIYNIVASNEFGCTSSVSVELEVLESPDAPILEQEDTEILVCSNEFPTINANLTANWYDSNGNLVNESSTTFQASDFRTYYIKSVNDLACESVDSVFFSLIEDNIPPVLAACPSDINLIRNIASENVVSAIWGAPTAQDNCTASVELSSNFESGTSFSETTAIQYIATDVLGNSDTCSFNINIELTDSLTFYVDTTAITNQGDLFTVPIKVLNFEDVRGFQYGLSLLLQDLEGSIEGITNIDNRLSESGTTEEGIFSQILETGIEIIITYDNAAPLTLTDSTCIFSLQVRLNGTLNACSLVTFSDTSIPLEAVRLINDELQSVIPSYINGEVCIPNTVGVAGRIYRQDELGVGGVEVACLGEDNFLTETDTLGFYTFEAIPIEDDYTIVPNLNENHKNGVDIIDIRVVRDYRLRRLNLNSPYQRIAADVNGDQRIDIFDIVIMYDVSLERLDTFPNNTSWRFVDANYIFPNPENPWMESFPETIELPQLASTSSDNDFIAIKIGDVDLSANRINLTEGEVALSIGSQTTEVGNLVQVPIYVEDIGNLDGFEFDILFDEYALDFHSIASGTRSGITTTNFNLNDAERGLLSLLWLKPHEINHQTGRLHLFDIVFKSKTEANIRNLVQLGAERMNGIAVKDNQRLAITFEYEENLISEVQSINSTQALQVHDCRPNPFEDYSYIDFYVPINEQVELLIYDINSKVVYDSKQRFSVGQNTWRINANNLPCSGLYFYQLRTSTFNSSIKRFFTTDR